MRPLHHQPPLRPLRLLLGKLATQLVMRALLLWKLALSGPLAAIPVGVGCESGGGSVTWSLLNGCGWARLCSCYLITSNYVYLCSTYLVNGVHVVGYAWDCGNGGRVVGSAWIRILIDQTRDGICAGHVQNWVTQPHTWPAQILLVIMITCVDHHACTSCLRIQRANVRPKLVAARMQWPLDP